MTNMMKMFFLSHLVAGGGGWPQIAMSFNIYNSIIWAATCWETVIQLKGILMSKYLSLTLGSLLHYHHPGWLNYFPEAFPGLSFRPT